MKIIIVLLLILSLIGCDKDMLLPPETNIACENIPLFEEFYINHGQVEILPQDLTCIPVYVETDYYTFQQLGSVEAVTEWIHRVFDEVKTIYANEQISIYLSSFFIPTSPGWSEDLNSTIDILYEFAQVRKDDPDGRLKSFWSMKPLGGGVAWVNVLCRNYFSFQSTNQTIHAGPYSVCTSMRHLFPKYPNYSWTVQVVSHELGHNFGSPHTQACAWGPDDLAIDNCYPHEGVCGTINPSDPGTIMSYCNQNVGIDFTKGFGELPGNLLRAAVFNATCMLRCEEECFDKIILSGNLVGSYVADTIIVNDAILIGDVVFDAKVLEIFQIEVPLGFTFEILNDGCQ